MAATSAPRIGVLAIQGAFREHVRSLCLCGAETVEIRTREDLEGLSGLVFPGGESTVMGKFLIEWGMMDRVRELIRSGMPVFGTCAGLILLCSDILDHPGQPRIGLLNASVRRNAFGRQIDSFTTPLELCPFPTANGNPTDQPPLSLPRLLQGAMPATGTAQYRFGGFRLPATQKYKYILAFLNKNGTPLSSSHRTILHQGFDNVESL